jgi:ribosomal protein S18 acetylase RimI-like enzyme
MNATSSVSANGNRNRLMPPLEQPSSIDTVNIRPYQASDRSSIRHICAETAAAGEPLENFFSDRELVSDLVTRYYTDFVSDYSWVAELNGQLVGYLTAAPDTHAFRKSLHWSIGPQAFLLALGRGLLFKSTTWAMAGALIKRKGQCIRPPFHVPENYPAHLHINLLKQARGHHTGSKLISLLLQKLKTNHVPGVHATVLANNAGACAFFERMDFKPIFEYDETLPANKGVRDVHVIVFGKAVR